MIGRSRTSLWFFFAREHRARKKSSNAVNRATGRRLLLDEQELTHCGRLHSAIAIMPSPPFDVAKSVLAQVGIEQANRPA